MNLWKSPFTPSNRLLLSYPIERTESSNPLSLSLSRIRIPALNSHWKIIASDVTVDIRVYRSSRRSEAGSRCLPRTKRLITFDGDSLGIILSRPCIIGGQRHRIVSKLRVAHRCTRASVVVVAIIAVATEKTNTKRAR